MQQTFLYVSARVADGRPELLLTGVLYAVKPVHAQFGMFLSGHGGQDLNPSAQLSSWDFLQDLDLVPEPDHILPSLTQSAKPGLASLDNTKEKNRLAQKRFRQRKKVRSDHVLKRSLQPERSSRF